MDSKEYIEKIFVTNSTAKTRILSIGGSKDSGKTTGIIFLSCATINSGYYVVEQDLKGKVNKKTSNGYAFLETFDGCI